MKKTVIFAALAAVAMTAPAFADSSSEVKTENTDQAGTTNKTDKSVKTTNHSNGSSKTVVKSSASNDPKGLMNKTSGSSKETIKTDANGNVASDQKKASGDLDANAPAR